MFTTGDYGIVYKPIFFLFSQVMSAFESCVKSHRERVDKERALAQQIMSMANTVFLHEVLRTPTQEAVLSDNNMIRVRYIHHYIRIMAYSLYVNVVQHLIIVFGIEKNAFFSYFVDTSCSGMRHGFNSY